MEGPAPTVSTNGNVGERDVAYATEKVTAIYKLSPRPITHATVRLRIGTNPSLQRPAIAEASLDMKRRAVRAHVAAGTLREAIDLLEARLKRQLHDLSERSQALRKRANGERTATRPLFQERAVAEREVVKRKTFSVSAMTPDEAVFDMEALDHDFYLFTNSDTGEDNLVSREPNGTYVLTQLRAYDLTLDTCAQPITVDEVVPPALDLEAAIELLNVENDHHVFFLDKDSGRGHVVYRRFDGNYGLIVPADE